MTAKYLVRLDDASESMDFDKWSQVEQVLRSQSIKPIVGLIPMNRDHTVMRGNPNSRLYRQTISRWRSYGWSFAMHGTTHEMQATGDTLIFPVKRRLEQANQPIEAYEELLSKAYNRLKDLGVDVKLWISPGHAITQERVELIHKTLSIDIFSDGYSIRPISKYGVKWLPCQLSSLRWRPFGLWTACLHPNTMSRATISYLATSVESLRQQITCLDEIIHDSFPQESLFDRFCTYLYHSRHRRH